MFFHQEQIIGKLILNLPMPISKKLPINRYITTREVTCFHNLAKRK